MAEEGPTHRIASLADQGSNTRASRLEPASDAVSQRLDDVLVVVQLETNRIHELNPTGARFWELLHEQDGDVDRIERQMLDEFDVSAEELRAEIDKLIAALEGERLVSVVERA